MSTNRRKQQARKRGVRQRAERQARRERAAELFAQGRTQAEVAAELDVSRQSASRWRARSQADGATALRTRGPTGRPPKVPDTALERIAVVIQGLTGVALSNPSVWRLLSERLGWSAQRPQRQAKERDEEAIQHWVAHEWPRSNKGPAQDRPGLSSSTNQRSSLIPPMRCTWSPRGHTPILRHPMAWKKASMAAALGYQPDGARARLCFHLRADGHPARI
jgi:transposase